MLDGARDLRALLRRADGVSLVPSCPQHATCRGSTSRSTLGPGTTGSRATCCAPFPDVKGVTSYTLDIVATADVKDGMKVVGSCEAGARKIVYTRK